MFASALSFSVLSTYSFYLCSGLSVVAFVLAVALIADPLMIFERRLVGIERKLDNTHRGFEGSSRLMDGLRWNGSLKEESFLRVRFCNSFVCSCNKPVFYASANISQRRFWRTTTIRLSSVHS